MTQSDFQQLVMTLDQLTLAVFVSACVIAYALGFFAGNQR